MTIVSGNYYLSLISVLTGLESQIMNRNHVSNITWPLTIFRNFHIKTAKNSCVKFN